MAKKIAVSQSTSGDMPDTGLDVLNSDGDSIEVALAKQLLGKEQVVIVKPQPVQAPTLPFGWTQVADIPKYQGDRLTGEQLQGELCQYTGSEQWYRHGLNKQMLYTDTQKCGCKWRAVLR